MNIHESGENYLETILVLKTRNGSVRSVDIANELGYSKPSVSRAMSILRNEGLIRIDSGGKIELTDIGHKAAEDIYERHTRIAEFLQKTLGVDKKTALGDSCRIEHVISDETFRLIKTWLDKHKD
ncbi:MAG: metal-dependent transcriptional regulator [Clostridiales Family XIII bacterium]|jgi:Mn-dependent DtxR family transcriptional regulator|nr:metal-dependent transcriptional regulator [Clostridiales Family XIII bacterium]